MMPLLRAFKPVTGNSLPRQAMCLDLRSSGQQLFAAMNGEARYNVQLARKSHLILAEYESSEALQWFYSLLQNVDARERIQYPSPSQLTTLCDSLCPSGTAKIYVARHKGVVLAAAIMIKFGQRATLLHGVVREHECRMMAGYGMLWHMIERSRQLGCNSFDLNCYGDQAQACNMAQLTWQCNGNVMRFVGAWQLQFSQFAHLTYSA
jgi:vancomycin resistance protein VanK